MNDDGVALTSCAHPKLVWYRRAWLWLRYLWRPALSPESLETIEINIEKRK